MSTAKKSAKSVELSISGHQGRLTFAVEQNPTVVQQIRASLIDAYIRRQGSSGVQSA